MLLASKVAKKNLIKNFLDIDWFNDYSTGGGTMSVDSVNPYKMTFSIISAQGRLIWIPVEIGKTYTFSFKSMNCLYRFYKRKVGNHDIAMNMVQDGNVGKPDTFSFTPDESYKGFVTLRLTHSQAGTYTVENLQLEVGSKTDFEPYTLVNPKASVPPVATKQVKKNLIKPLTDSGWTKHANAVFVSDYYLKINQTASFQTSGIDVALQAGSSYTLSVDEISPNGRIYVRQTLNGAFTYYIVTATTKSLSFTAVAGASYRVEFHANTSLNVEEYVKNFQLALGSIAPFEPYKAINPVATLYPKKNLIPDLVSFPNTNDRTKLVYENENRLIMNATALTDYVNIQFPAKKVKQYTLWATELNENARVAIREVKADGTKTFLTNLTQVYMSHTFTTTSSVDKIEIECTVKTVGKCVFDKVQLEEGNKTTFERYILSNLRSE